MRVGILFGLILFSLIFLLIPGVQAQGGFQTSYSCIDCHQDRYQEWARSMHAIAVSDPIFEAAYLKALKSDPKYRYFCLTCHSPLTRVTNDYNLTKSITVEGITCSFCHSVVEVENNSYIFNQSNLMQGPYNDSKTDAHASKYSEFLTKAEFCAGCHEFSINGVPISQTYSEWKEGPYAAEGHQCQDCHMEPKRGIAAKDGPLREEVYQHFWYGGHSGQFLAKAFQIESSVQQIGNRVKVMLNITNAGVGHKIPSGLPSRKVVLSFKASDEQGRGIFSEERTYSKTLVDQYGNEVDDFWKGTSITKDNRIKPRESRIEVFEFDVPNGTNKLQTSSTLTYRLQSQILQPVLIDVEIAKNSTPFFQVEKKAAEIVTPKGAPGTGWLETSIAMILVIFYLNGRRKRNE